MYSLSIHFGPSQMCWAFLFKDKDRAEQAFRTAASLEIAGQSSAFQIADDFGQNGMFNYSGVHGILLEDMDVSQEAAIQRGLHQARGQAKAQSRAGSDTTLRTLSAGRGPAILSQFPQSN
jgi:hypothetical protein